MSHRSFGASLDSKELVLPSHPLRSTKFFYFALYFVVSTFCVAMAFFLTLYRCIGQIDRASYITFLLICLLPIVVLIGLGFRHYITKPEHFYFILAVPSLAAFSTFMVAGNVPDEPAHIWQAVALFSRNPNGFYIPAILSDSLIPHNYADLWRLLNVRDTWSNVIVCERYLGSYLPHLYLIPGLAMSLGRFVGANVYLVLIIGRYLNSLLFLVSSIWMLRIIPVGKTALLVFLMNPMLIQQQASCSADVISNISALCFITYLLNLVSRTEIQSRQVLCLVLLGLFMAISKYAYAPLLLLLFVFVRRINSTRTKRLLYIGSFSGILLAVILIVTFYHGGFMPESFELMRNPVNLVSVYLKSIWEMGSFWISSYAGQFLGALNITTWQPCFWAYMVLQFCVLFYGDDTAKPLLEKSDKVIISLCALVDFSLILLSMREWSLTVDHRADIIMGVQGRYLFPVLFPVLMCMQRQNESEQRVVLKISSVILSLIVLLDLVVIVLFFN